uniref:Rap guanine nucleotide exchange factor (GEF)-like 1 n=1 Tax=Acanthochromis polyacanthus TaxID=80966 RepID=A0A3Q1FI15_9TELE
MPAGMKPLEKFLKKQTTALTRAGGFVGGVADKASGGTGASRRRASLSRVVPFFRETSPESGQAREVFRTLLDDFMLTHPIFLTADRLQQVLLQGGDEDVEAAMMDAAERKQAVLNVAFRYLDTYRELLQEEGERSNCFPKELYLCAVQELTRYPELVEDVLKLQRWTEILHCSEEEKESRKKQVRPLFRHFRRIDACLQPREAFRGSDEFCRVYTPDHSYVTIRSRLSCRVGEILALVREKLQYSEDQPVLPGNLILVAVTSAGKAVFRPSDEAVFTTLGVNTHLFACEPSELDSLLPLPEEIHWSPGDSKLHDMSAEEVSNQLVVFDWELFSCVHEVEFVCYVFHGEQSRWRPLNLELVLQRCSEVQHWVATEILQCQSLPKRIQLLRKFIKIAACKQQQDLLSFLAVVLGLDNPAVSRLRLTWEGLPGKFRKQFQQFESIADPSRNHKSYRDLITSLRPPLIPFTPLLLKLTFLHESCKTFHGELVNFEKMHKVAEMVRIIRRYRSSQLMDTETSPSHLQTKAYVRQLQVIDNQNLLFDMSCKLEPKDT